MTRSLASVSDFPLLRIEPYVQFLNKLNLFKSTYFYMQPLGAFSSDSEKSGSQPLLKIEC